MAVKDRALLEAATKALLASPSASLTEVAAAAGVSRTTLHYRYPTRQTLVLALAHDALDLLEAAYAESRLDDGPVREALERLVERMLPIGPRTEFLLRERSLDEDVEFTRRCAEVDRPVLALVERGQEAGELRRDLPGWWLVSVLVGMVYVAWEGIAEGRLAPRDAPDLVLTSVLDGVATQ